MVGRMVLIPSGSASDFGAEGRGLAPKLPFYASPTYNDADDGDKNLLKCKKPAPGSAELVILTIRLPKLKRRATIRRLFISRWSELVEGAQDLRTKDSTGGDATYNFCDLFTPPRIGRRRTSDRIYRTSLVSAISVMGNGKFYMVTEISSSATWQSRSRTIRWATSGGRASGAGAGI